MAIPSPWRCLFCGPHYIIAETIGGYPPDARAAIHFALTGKLHDHRLNIKQIIGLWLASEPEFVELARKAAAEGLSQNSFKKSVSTGSPNHDKL